MYKHVKSLIIAVTLAMPAYAQADATVVKTLKGFAMPESVLPVGSRIYVSEIGEFGKDGDGSISYIENGKRTVFATGMDDPKGLAYRQGNLYVADKTRILKVGSDGKWKVFAAAEAFPVKPQFLNDLTFDKAGTLYVSDSGDLNGKGGAVFKVSPEGKVDTIISATEDKRVLAPNGLLPDGKEFLLMVDFFSGNLYRISIKSGRMTQIAEGFGGGDGIARDSKGVLWVSDWKNGRLFSLKKNGELKLEKYGFQAAADIDIAADGKTIIVPDMKAGEIVWVK